jgi:dTDP-4-amino-4,6-dideoxygalactose transaminase
MIPVTQPSLPPLEEYMHELEEVWATGILTHTGPKHQLLEQKLKDYLDVKNLALFANGHLALELAIEALQLHGEVITTPYTFASTTQAIVRNRLKPVFCDINAADFTIDTSKIEALITPNTSAIIPVHVYGNLCDVNEIDRIAKKHGLKVIYDAAHAFGEQKDGTAVGQFGDMSMFSFHATKVFNTVEGGGVSFLDSKYNQIFAQLRQFGMQDSENVPIVGTNAKMTEVHAAMGLCNLRYVSNEIQKRKKLYLAYHERLKNVNGIYLNPDQSKLERNYAYYPVVFEGYKRSRDEVFEKLLRKGYNARKYFYPLTNSFQCYTGLVDSGYTPVAERIANSVLCLPLFANLSCTDVEKICDIILS